MVPPPAAGALVATVADLAAACTHITDKLEEQKRQGSTDFDGLRLKLESRLDAIDEILKTQGAAVDTLMAEVAEMKKTRVTVSDCKSQVSALELKCDTANGELQAMIKKVREDDTRDLNASVQSLTSKCDSIDAGLSAVREQVNTIDTEIMPEARKALDEERNKRRTEDLRLEREIEATRAACERRIDESASAGKQDLEATDKKLRADLASGEDRDALGREIAALKVGSGSNMQDLESKVNALRAAHESHREATSSSFDKSGNDMTQLMKDLASAQSTLHTLNHGTGLEFKKVRDSLREHIQQLQRDLSDARATAAQAAVNNDKNVQAIAGDVVKIKDFKYLLSDKLKIEDVAGLVREWQKNQIPEHSVAISDLEARVQRLRTDLQVEHDAVEDLQRNNSQIKGHFKMFHQIATGLDSQTVEHTSAPPKMTLPPIGQPTPR